MHLSCSTGTVHDNEVEHLIAGIALDGACGNLAVKGGICAEQKLLAGLSAGIEGTAHLDASEGAVGQVAAVFARERNTLRNALVDDGCADFRKTVYVGFTGTIVSTFDGVVEETVDGVVVVLVVLGCIDTSLGSDGMGPAGRVTDAENLDIVTKFTERSGCRSASETGSYYYDLELSLVVGTDEMNLRLAFRPFFGERSVWNLGN